MANRPIKDFRAGNIKAAIFLNQKEVNGNMLGFKTVAVSRSFKKKDEDIWRSEQINLRRNDLPKMILILQKTYEELAMDPEDDDGEE